MLKLIAMNIALNNNYIIMLTEAIISLNNNYIIMLTEAIISCNYKYRMDSLNIINNHEGDLVLCVDSVVHIILNIYIIP